MKEQVAGIVAYYQALMGLRDWQLTVEIVDSDEFLARVLPVPERSIARMQVSSRCPPEELRATIAHELCHVLLSPLTSLVADERGAVMLEEQAVDKLSLALARARSSKDVRAMSRAIQGLPARLRARVTIATAIKRRVGGNMLTPEQIQKALDALESGDVESCKGALKEILASMASGGHAEPDGDEGGGVLAKDPTPGIGDGADGGGDMGAADRGGVYRGKARSGGLTAAEVARSRKTLASIEKDGVASLLARERTIGVEIPAEVEKEILACSTREDAERMMRIAKLSSGAVRARSGATGSSAGADAMGGAAALPVSEETLRAEGFDASWIAQYKAAHANDPNGAAIFLKGGRDRKATQGNAWTRKTPINGGN